MKKLFVLLVVLALFFGFYKYFTYQKTNFVLQGAKGPVSLSQFKGKKLILYFGYTSCPDVCPTELGMLSKVLHKLKEPKDVQVIFISLDPQRDNNIKEVTEFVRYFYKPAIALLASPKELKKITKYFGVEFYRVDLKDSFMKYSIAHSGEFYLISKDGKFLGPVKDLRPKNLYKEISKFVKS